MLPTRLSQELSEIDGAFDVEAHEEATVVDLIFRNFPTSAHYSLPTTTILLRVPKSYPDAGLDMFWTDVELALANGGVPQGAGAIESYMGRSWRRFSWHHGSWNPNVHNLHTYLDFVRRRFRESN